MIGAGIGGLSAAIRLAAAGLSVTVVETQPYPGGKMRALPSAVGPIDAGPTVLTMRHVFDDLFSVAGERLDDHLTLVPQPILARHWWPDGSRLDLFADPEASTAAIADFAGPRAADEFRRFNRQTAQLYAAFRAPMIESASPRLAAIARNSLLQPGIWPALRPQRTLSRHLDQCFGDPRLRQLFGRYATYVGGAPDRSPAVLGLIWQAEAQGVWAVKGGMHRLAQALCDLAGRLGVTFRFGVSALRIQSKGGRVTEVVLSDTRTIRCEALVFNGDPAALLAGLLGNGPQQALPQSAAQPRSLSAAVWSFAATPGPVDLVHHNVFFASEPSREFGPIAAGQIPEDPTLYVCAQDRGDPGYTGSGPERFEIIMNAPPKTALSIGEVAACRNRTFPMLARFGLTFDPPPPDTALTTPQGFAALFPGSQGALYGRSPEGPLANFRRPGARTRLPGLYLAGGGAHPGAGVPMAALSGLHAVAAITNDLTSASKSSRTATHGGMSTASRTTGRAPSR